MSKHAPFSPSSLYRIEACPASYRHNSDRPEGPPSEYAKEGTEAHALAEELLLSGAELTEDTPEPIRRYVAYVRELAAQPGAELHVEQRVKVMEDMWGTADAVITQFGGTLKVVDLKYGIGVKVDPVDNLQGTAYLLGALKKYKNSFPQRAEVHIYQPRVYDDAKVWAIDDIPAFVATAQTQLEAIQARALADNPGFQTGDHCGFCPGKLDCPKMREEALAVAKRELSPTTVASAEVEQLVAFHEKAKQVKTFLDAVEKELFNRAVAGEEVPGYKLVQKRGNLAWTTDEETLVKKMRNKRLKTADIYTQKIRTPTQLKKQLGEKFLEEHADRPNKGLTLVPESDKRQPAALEAAKILQESTE